MVKRLLRRSGLFVVVTGFLVFSTAGSCASLESTDFSTYFPSDPGRTWTYVGEGNEFASFTQKVIFRSGLKVQMAVDNGGTRVMKVFRVEPGTVRLTLAMPEVYDNRNLLNAAEAENKLLLQSPLRIGATWKDDTFLSRIVSSSEKVTVPAGTFENVLKIKRTPLDKSQSAYHIYEYYAVGTGLVMQEFLADGFRVVSRLHKVSMAPR